MSASPFTDKQIMGLSDLMNPQVPSYDVGPIRTVGSSSSAVDVSSSTSIDNFARNSRGSLDSTIDSATRRYSNILEHHELPKVSHEKERNSYDVVTVSEVNQTVKKYTDNLLHALEGVSSRLSQLESRTRHLEDSIDELKDIVGNNSSSTDGKLRQLESILREAQTGVQVLCDKQNIAEAHFHLTKLPQSASQEDHHQPPPSNAIAPQGSSSLPSYQPAPPPSVVAPPQHPPPQFPTQLTQSQLPSVPSLTLESSYFPPPGVHPMQPQPQPPPQSQHYQLPHYSHQQMPSGPTFSDGYSYSGGSPSHYSGAMMYPSPFSSSPPSSSGGGRGGSSMYSRLPRANVLPQAAPIGPRSSPGDRVPVDDVVDKVVTMGFSREEARATVRKLMENGQSVDLNVVLDKLMNGR